MWSRRRRIILVSSADQVSVAESLVHCRGLADQGWRRVVIDASGVTGCDRAGLPGLGELRDGRGGLEVQLTGLRWTQLFPALQATALAELRAAHHQIRALIDGEAPDPAPTDPAPSEPCPLPRPRGRHRPIPAAITAPVA